MFKELTARIAQLNEELNDELNEDFDVDSGALEEPYEYNSYIDDNDEFEEKEELGDLEDDIEGELDDDIDDFDDLDGLDDEDIEDVEESDMLDEDIDLLIESFLEESESFDTLEEDNFIDSLLDENVSLVEEEDEFDFEDSKELNEAAGGMLAVQAALAFYTIGATNQSMAENHANAAAIRIDSPEFKEAFKFALDSIMPKAKSKKLTAVTDADDLGAKEQLKVHRGSSRGSSKTDISKIEGHLVLVEKDSDNRAVNISAIFKDRKDKIKMIRIPIRKFYNVKIGRLKDLTEGCARLIAEDALFEELTVDVKKYIIQSTESLEEGIELYNEIENILNEGIDDKRVHDRALKLALAETNMIAKGKNLTPVKNKSGLDYRDINRISRSTMIDFAGQVLAVSNGKTDAFLQDLLGRTYTAVYVNESGKIVPLAVKMSKFIKKIKQEDKSGNE